MATVHWHGIGTSAAGTD